tara:strand:+ start:596 stop:937 length:342 start_codon:yes stop_codon:yes gene_type:complete
MTTSTSTCACGFTFGVADAGWSALLCPQCNTITAQQADDQLQRGYVANLWPYYPDVVVQLTGTDGNAFAVIAAVEQALRAAVGGGVADAFRDEAMKGSYDALLRTVMRWVEVH